MSLRPFHLALPTVNLKTTQTFYVEVLGCGLGRTTDSWIDLNFFGHQLVFHDCGGEGLPVRHNPVDSHKVPIPHFGIVLAPDAFLDLHGRIDGKVKFIIPPDTRFLGTVGEQRTLFFLDPNNYALEFKSFADDRFIFEPFHDKTQRQA